LAEQGGGTKVGERVIVTASQSVGGGVGTRRPGAKRQVAARTEVRTIKSMDGVRLTFDEPLKYAHQGEGDYRAAVANLSRNVVVESAEPEGVRGPTMYHPGS